MTAEMVFAFEQGSLLQTQPAPAKQATVLVAGRHQPRTDVALEFGVPPEVLATLTPDVTVGIYARTIQYGEDILDNFVLLPSVYESTRQSVKANVPPTAFANERRSDGQFEAILVVAAAPRPAWESFAASAQASGGFSNSPLFDLAATAATKILPRSQGTCPISIGSPLPIPLQVFSHVGARKNPKGVLKDHEGTDYAAVNSTAAIAVASGKATVLSPDKPDGIGGGYGLAITLDPPYPPNTVVKYRHLLEGSITIPADGRVKAGDVIAATNSSGTYYRDDATSDVRAHPHLHLEVWSGGERLDADACTPNPNSPSITGAWSGQTEGASGYLTLIQTASTIRGSATGFLSETDNGPQNVAASVEGTVSGAQVFLTLSAPGYESLTFTGYLMGHNQMLGTLVGSGFDGETALLVRVGSY